MHIELDRAVQAYEHCRLDGAAAEGVRRDVKQTCLRSAGSKFAHWAATQRLEQNIKDWQASECSPARQQRFLTYFSEPARLFADKWPSPPAVATMVVMQRREMISQVYRIFPYNMEDWTFLHSSINLHKPKKEKQVVSEARAVMIDFFEQCFKAGRFFSAKSAHGLPTLGSEVPSSDIDTWKVFEVIQDNCARKKTLDHATADFVLPLQIQAYMAQSGSNAATRLLLLPSGLPELVDGAKLVSWHSATQDLHLWRHHELHMDPLHTVLTDPILATDSFQVTDETTPSYILLKELGRRGWRPADIDWHDATAPKHLLTHNAPRRKTYLRFLLQSEPLFEKGLRAHSRQHELYYHCLLVLPPTTVVPHNLLVKAYKQLLLDGGLPVPEPERPQQTTTAVGEEVHSEDSSLSDSGSEPNARPEGEEASAIVEANGEEPAVEEPQSDHATPTLRSLGLPPQLLGCRLGLDTNVAHGYQRIYVVCPLAAAEHRHHLPCRKYRALSASSGVEGLGALDAVAYLGAWIQAAPRFALRKQHVDFRPSRKDVEAFVQAGHLPGLQRPT